ncbi:MAG: FadR/GntR family transcriptional regulator [Anaerolineae bacterium]
MTKHSDALPAQIAQSLLQRIISEEFPPGAMFPSERDLQDEYHVSRSVVREAIKLLASRKLLSVSHGQGAVVTSNFNEPVVDALLMAFHRAQIRAEDIFAVRALLEPHCVALAAQHATLQQVRRLEELAQSFEVITFEGNDEAFRRSLMKWGKLDNEFHQLLAEASQNAVNGILITVIVGVVWNSISAKMPAPPPDRFAVAAQQHLAIARAVAQQDSEAARRAMVEHIETSLHNIASPNDRVPIRIETFI